MRRNGFSLLELMMVLLIITVIVQISVPYIAASKMSSNEAVVEKILSNMSMASEQYSAENGIYPISGTQLAVYMEGQQYCGQVMAGFTINCTFGTGDTYFYEGIPVQYGQTGSRSFSIATGGAWGP